MRSGGLNQNAERWLAEEVEEVGSNEGNSHGTRNGDEEHPGRANIERKSSAVSDLEQRVAVLRKVCALLRQLHDRISASQ